MLEKILRGGFMELQAAIGYWAVFCPTVLFLFLAGYLICKLIPFTIASIFALAIIQLYIPGLTLPNNSSYNAQYAMAIAFSMLIIIFSVSCDINRFKARLIPNQR